MKTIVVALLALGLAGCGGASGLGGMSPTEAAILKHPWWKPGITAEKVEAIAAEIAAHGEGYVFYDKDGQYAYLPVSAFMSRLHPPKTVMDATDTFMGVPGVGGTTAESAKSLEHLGRPRRVVVIIIQPVGQMAGQMLRDSLDHFDSESWRAVAPTMDDLFGKPPPSQPKGRRPNFKGKDPPK